MPLSTHERRHVMRRELYTESVLADFFMEELAISDDDETPIITCRAVHVMLFPSTTRTMRTKHALLLYIHGDPESHYNREFAILPISEFFEQLQ